jgi:Uma2 family endonuclease
MATPSVSTLPRLKNGDRLTRFEFERRYQAMPSIKKAELIEGKVYMPSPVTARHHSQPHAYLTTWLGTYAVHTPGVTVHDNATVQLDLDNEPQPDALLRIDEACGGQSCINDDDYIEGAPELVVEVAHSSAAYDLHDKKRAYRRNGVQEYVVWQMEEARLDWFQLEGGAYVVQSPDENGCLHSVVFPGLVLDAEALLDDDPAAVLTRLNEALGSETHRNFVSQLEEARSDA